MLENFNEDNFQKNIKEILRISNEYRDGWKLHQKEGTKSIYITKKCIITLGVIHVDMPNITVTFEYHIAYHKSYCVPILAFNIWKPDGTKLTLEEFWKYNSQFNTDSMYDTLTQLDHPVLQTPILTLHPCRTHEVIQPFIEHSKNPVVSWLTTIGHFVHLELCQAYLKLC